MSSPSELVAPSSAQALGLGLWRYDRFVFLLGVLAWRVALDAAYAYLLFPLNEYFGFRFAPDGVRIIESYFLTLAGALTLPSRSKLPSSFALHVFFLLAIVPILSYYALAGEARWMLYGLVGGYGALVTMVWLLPPLIVPALQGRRSLAVLLMAAMVTAASVSLLARVGLDGINLDLTKVYEHREEITAEIYSGLWAYLYSWVGGAVGVALMIYLLSARRLALAGLALLAQLYMFAATSHKVYLFLPIIALATYALLSFRSWRSWMVWGLCGLIFGSVALFMTFELDVVGDLVVRRTLYVPAYLDFRYLEFFSSSPKVLLTNSVLSPFGDYPYGDVPSGLVVGNFIGFPDTNAVTGYLGTAFMNFGISGLVVYSAILAAVLRLLDGCVALGLPSAMVAAASIGPVRAVLTESDLFTTLLTHGLGVTVILLMMLTTATRKPAPRLASDGR